MGLNTKDLPSALAPSKFPCALNIRTTAESNTRSRPGYVPAFRINNGSGPGITDIRAYAQLSTDDYPRFLVRDQNSNIWLDTGNLATSLAAPAGYGVSMLPFRPAESPVTWMYVGSEGDYQKISAPMTANNNTTVTAQKVGIAEPQTQVEAGPSFPLFSPVTGNSTNWNNSGVAGAPSDNVRSNDQFGTILRDPASPTRYYAQVNANNANAAYSAGQLLVFGNNTGEQNGAIVQDVYPPVANNIAIQGIYYANNNNGPCVVVPAQMPIGSEDPEAQALTGLRRGSLVTFSQSGNNETVLVLSVISGPNAQFCFECNTNNSWSNNSVISGLSSIAIDQGGGFNIGGLAGANISTGYVAANFNFSANNNVSVGVGTVTRVIGDGAYPFGTIFVTPPNNNSFVPPFNNAFPQEDDYVHLSMFVSDPTQLIQILVMFNLDANNFTSNVLYYTLRPSDFAAVLSGNNTVLTQILGAAENEIIAELTPPGQTAPAQSTVGNNQWTELLFPVSSLSRVGDDQTLTASNINSIAFQVQCQNNITVGWSSIWIGGGNAPDIGNNGVPYRYRLVPRSSLTGVRGNPTPVMRYPVPARRQPVTVKSSLVSASYDSQIDTWEVYRYGGSILSYRFLGTTPTGSDFLDTAFDDALTAGSLLQTDNTEPWPSIDAPWKVTSAQATFTVVGTKLVVSGYSAWPSTISRWLPGTLFQFANGQAYTLRQRPVQLSSTSYLFTFEECAGVASPAFILVLEPNVARDTLPYLWGPDAQGFIFGCGDPLRPGTASFTKPYTPDSVPTAYNLDLCPPSEPLIGGEVIAGISVVASSKRWWAFYFQNGNPEKPFQAVEIPMGKRLASPYGKCTDGAMLYFWSDEGICEASPQGGAKSLTDDDLYNLFPHAGQLGKNVQRNAVIFYAPDYTRAETFRLGIRDGMLFADYQDSNGLQRVMVCDLARKAWVGDQYNDPIAVHYGTEQQVSPLESAPSNYPRVMMGDTNGYVWSMQDGVTDNGADIQCVMGTFEYDGGDIRVNELWGDGYLDSLPTSELTVRATSNGIGFGPVNTIPAATVEQLSILSMDGGILSNYFGLQISWSESYANGVPVQLYAWQPSFAEQVEITEDRYGDWTNAATPKNKFFQGIRVDADTFGSLKTLQIRDADTNTLHQIQGPGVSAINHNGRMTLPYSFKTPFVAHSVRDETQDLVPWRKFGIEYVWEATPEAVLSWITQWTALGGKGYMHIPRIEAAWASLSPVTLTIASYDGTSPALLQLPSTNGVYQKQLLTLTFNKGQLYQFSATSSTAFQLFLNDWIVWRGEWGREEGYTPYRLLGGEFSDRATI